LTTPGSSAQLLAWSAAASAMGVAVAALVWCGCRFGHLGLEYLPSCEHEAWPLRSVCCVAVVVWLLGQYFTWVQVRKKNK
jgi:hypothetical protein